MNFPILYSSTHQLSNVELKKYIQNFQEHWISFTIYDNFRLVSYHKFKDELYIRLEWFIKREKCELFKIPTDLESLFSLENNEITEFKRGNIVHYSKVELATTPNEEAYNTFYEIIRKKRPPIREDEYDMLEYPKYRSEPKIKDEQLNKMITLYKQFQDYLQNRAIENKNNSKKDNKRNPNKNSKQKDKL